MPNLNRGFWRTRNFGVKAGLFLTVLDMLVFLLQLAALQAGILPEEFSVGFARLWVALHWPTHELLVPLVWPYLPSHGAGLAGVIAMSVYVVGCGLHAFIVGFSLGHIAQFLLRQLRGAKA